MANSPEMKTGLLRLSYARDLFTARAIDDSRPDVKKFGCTLIGRKSDTATRQALEKLCLDTIVAEWGPKGVERLKNKTIKTPFFDGEGPEARYKGGPNVGDLHPGMGPDVWFIRVSANPDRPPAIRWKNPNLQETEKYPDGVYSGCWGKAVVNAFTTDHPKGGQRVSLGISMFQKLQEGELLGGAGGGPVDAEKYYETVADEGPAPESTKQGAGAASLFSD
jgi:Protein of unknown function (DUF2815)